jgi:hypothetical protein
LHENAFLALEVTVFGFRDAIVCQYKEANRFLEKALASAGFRVNIS